jgi:predicted membrane protein
MNKFSVKILKDKIKIYRSSRQEYDSIITKYNLLNTQNLLCQTFLEDEITFYYYSRQTEDNHINHHILSKFCQSDNRIYTIIDIYEDIPGIDHIGIINYISNFFVKKNIPILYINTYGHNLIFISEEHIKNAIEILKIIGNIDEF